MRRTKTQLTLDELADPRVADDELPIEVCGIMLRETPPPKVVENLQKLQKLGVLSGDTLLALVAQAPIDPVNLMGTLMRLMPNGWVFSAIDFSMMHVLARDAHKAVAAALHVDLLAGDKIKFLARNRAGQLVEYKEYVVTPGPDTWDTVQALMAETVAAAEREAKQ